MYLDIDDVHGSRWGRVIEVEIHGQPAVSQSDLYYEGLSLRLNSMWWSFEAKKKAGASATQFWLLEDWLDADVKTWVYVSAEWKLDSDNASENFIRLWVDGFCIGTVNGVTKFEYSPQGNDPLGIFGNNGSTTMGIAGYGDSIRINSSLISEMYDVDEYFDYDPPTVPFEVPAIESCEEALKYGKWQLAADIDGDCHVGYGDISKLTEQWLDCVNPEDENCMTPWE